MHVEQTFFVGIQDVGKGCRIANKALLEALTNTANLHASMIGQGAVDIASRGLTWVVVNWKLRVLQRPMVCESIRVRTWAQSYSRVHAARDFDVFNEAGGLVAQATSIWAAVDPERFVPVRLTPQLMDAYGCDPEHKNFPDFRFPKTVRQELPVLGEGLFTVNRSMIDCNGHVHNPAYLDLAAEILPDEPEVGRFDNVEISYKREIRPGETVALSYAADGEKRRVLIRDRTDNALHAVILLY